ncbi:MAG: SGNH/GDSL hydrolase family protein [Planctomycetaceae bacterium]
MSRSGRSIHTAAANRPTRRRRQLIQSSRIAVEPVGAATEACERPSANGQVAEGLAAVKPLLSGATPINWLFTGDSITHGALYTEGWRSFVELFAERVRWELRRFDDVVINTAVCGERTEGLLLGFERRVARFAPDVVFVLLGMNDSLAGPVGRCAFRDNLGEIVGRVREAGAIPVVQTPNTIYAPHALSRLDLPAYVEIVRDVAQRCDAPLIDHWREWEGAKSDPGQLLEWLQDQSIHPNHYGHRAMARTLYRALEIFDPASLACSLAVP